MPRIIIRRMYGLRMDEVLHINIVLGLGNIHIIWGTYEQYATDNGKHIWWETRGRYVRGSSQAGSNTTKTVVSPFETSFGLEVEYLHDDSDVLIVSKGCATTVYPRWNGAEFIDETTSSTIVSIKYTLFGCRCHFGVPPKKRIIPGGVMLPLPFEHETKKVEGIACSNICAAS